MHAIMADMSEQPVFALISAHALSSQIWPLSTFMSKLGNIVVSMQSYLGRSRCEFVMSARVHDCYWDNSIRNLHAYITPDDSSEARTILKTQVIYTPCVWCTTRAGTTMAAHYCIGPPDKSLRRVFLNGFELFSLGSSTCTSV